MMSKINFKATAFRSRAVVVSTWWPADFAHKTWLHSQKVLFVWGGGSNFDNVFFSWWWKRGSKHHYKRAFIGLPAKHHLNGVSLIDNPTSVTYIRSLPNMEWWLGGFVILWGTGLVCLETLFLVIFSGGLVRTPCPPPPSWIRPWAVSLSWVCMKTDQFRSLRSRYKIVRLHRHKSRDLLFLPRTLVGKDEHVHPTLTNTVGFMVVSCADPGIFARGEGDSEKKLW